jgi:hypothetical protein
MEGGGNHSAGREQLRLGMNEFLREFHSRARQRGIRWRIVPCGSRNQTFPKFGQAVARRPEVFNVLLVDSEGPVVGDTPREHLGKREGANWQHPNVDDSRYHLMVQMMEAWFLADPEMVQQYYGRGFHLKSLPTTVDVEQVSKPQIEQALKRAAAGTAKMTYDKTRDGPSILMRIRAGEVRKRARHCERLLQVLQAVIDGN